MSDDNGTAIEDFLTRYADTLTRFDAHGAADLWSMPGLIVDDRFSGVTDSRDAMVESLERSYPLYRQLGLASVGYELQSTTELSPVITLIGVRWLFRDAEGRQLTDSNTFYLLRRGADGQLQTCVCVQTDDLEKLQALAADRGVQLPGQPD